MFEYIWYCMWHLPSCYFIHTVCYRVLTKYSSLNHGSTMMPRLVSGNEEDKKVPESGLRDRFVHKPLG